MPNIVTSILRYFVYFHKKRFLKQPTLLSPYLKQNDLNTIQISIPFQKVWTTKKDYGSKAISKVWLANQPNKANIRNVCYAGISKYGGVTAIKYKEMTKVVPLDEENHWKKFLQTRTLGITQRGQLLLQRAIESYVYSILGAQVKMRWVIVGDGAKSFQTQVIFHQIVAETIVQGNDAVLVTNMRNAIKGSSVALKLAILPDVILVPSKMLILDKPVQEYNNVLTLAQRSM